MGATGVVARGTAALSAGGEISAGIFLFKGSGVGYN
jgi:hypothetical protein